MKVFYLINAYVYTLFKVSNITLITFKHMEEPQKFTTTKELKFFRQSAWLSAKLVHMCTINSASLSYNPWQYQVKLMSLLSKCTHHLVPVHLSKSLFSDM